MQAANESQEIDLFLEKRVDRFNASIAEQAT
jgi:hypothetical protein